MNELQDLLTSPSFWVASVIIAFLMSFFASYAKDWTDKLFKIRSEKKDKLAKDKQLDFESKVEKLSSDQTILALYQSNIIYQKLRQVLYLTVTYLFLALGLYSTFNNNFVASGALFIMAGFMMFFTVHPVSNQLYELRSVVNAALKDDDIHFVD
jgi:hypothetical protein